MIVVVALRNAIITSMIHFTFSAKKCNNNFHDSFHFSCTHNIPFKCVIKVTVLSFGIIPFKSYENFSDTKAWKVFSMLNRIHSKIQITHS